jgi:hypothetical protein
MGRLLDKVIAETAKLPEEEQEAFAAFMLAELESERRWDDLFARSQDLLARMAEEARQEVSVYRSNSFAPEVRLRRALVAIRRASAPRFRAV